MNIRKGVIVSMVAVMAGTAGFGMAPGTAEAGPFDGIGAAMGVSTGSDVSVEGLTNKQNEMLRQVANAVILLNLASNDVEQALGMEPEVIANRNMVVENLTSGENQDVGFMETSLNANKVPSEEIKANLKNVLASGDQAKIAEINSSMGLAENKRIASGVCVALAVRDAASIVKDTGIGIRQGKEVDTLQQFLSTAQKTQELIKLYNTQMKALNTATGDYKKTQKITSPKADSDGVAAELHKGPKG